MTVKEMHIEFGQASQKISSNSNRRLFPEEIDWILNKSSDRRVQSCVKPRKDGSGGFEVDQVDLDVIRPLLVTTQLDAQLYDAANGEYKAQLPGDYAYLISDDSYTTQLCGAKLPTPQTVNLPYVIQVMPSGAGTGPYFADTNLTVGTISVDLGTIASNRLSTFAGYVSKEQRFMLIKTILMTFRAQGVEIYWEKAYGLFAPKGFIIIPKGQTVTSAVGNGNTAPWTSRAVLSHTQSMRLPPVNGYLTGSPKQIKYPLCWLLLTTAQHTILPYLSYK